MDIVQGALDVAGLAPVVGILADGLNAGISTARGNYADAALSMAAAIPIVGTAAGAAKLTYKGTKALRKATQASQKVTGRADDLVGVFRVYGGKSKPRNYSWTPVNPNSVSNFRDVAGLPNANTGRFVIEGNVKRSDIIKSRPALPLDGNKGGL